MTAMELWRMPKWIGIFTFFVIRPEARLNFSMSHVLICQFNAFVPTR